MSTLLKNVPVPPSPPAAFEMNSYEGTFFSGKKCLKDDHLSAPMLSCLLADFYHSSITVKFDSKNNISSGVYLVFFQGQDSVTLK